ncbi:MAG: ArsR family transcriptional regulator [Acidimicrobiia bacterium]|nr:ArsR family transcriptional regulator [Acidimicrobiia bacterium]MDH5295323.1 ArsR family transcriptional regulator [Acidimicrobiia bacterium]
MSHDVFAALGDPTRRAIFEQLGQRGAQTASQLADLFPVSRQAISKHLGLLEAVGLVERRRIGNRVDYLVVEAALAEVEQWVRRVRSAWDERLDRIDPNGRANLSGSQSPTG